MSESDRLFEEARRWIPGGVNSSVRAFASVGGDPIFMERAEGAYLYDVDGRRYIDYVGSWGPMIVGHAHPEVVRAVQEAAAKSLSFGTPTLLENRMAERLCELVPSLDMVRLVNSGTEATMSAVRLARGYTGRDKIIKFEGNYHGHTDSLLVKAGSGALTLGIPGSPGIPEALAGLTTTCVYNDLDSVREAVAEIGDEVACIIVEPVAGNMNCVPPEPGFLEGLREICDERGIVLIFDEVMTGFRVGLAGAQGRYGVTPDLTALGKIIGGGLPVGAFGGRGEIMEHLAPAGPVYQAGTLSGNPLAMAAGLATLDIVARPGFHDELEARTTRLVEGLASRGEQAGVPLVVNQAGSMFGVFFTDAGAVRRFDDVTGCDKDRFKRFFRSLLRAGVYLAPSPFEAGFVSAAHSDGDIDATLEAAGTALQAL